MPTPHQEHIRNWRTPDSEIDQPNLRVNNIALTGRNSKNGYQYSEEALRQAVPLYENKPVFLDHAANIARPHERSTRDLVGSIINPRYADGRIRGDIQLLDTEAGRTFLALAAAKNPAVGMSHVVLAERNPDRTVVEKIHDVVSVDAVTFPATTSTFSESKSDNPPPALPGSLESLLHEIDTQLPTRVCQLLNNPAAQIIRREIYPDQILLEVTTPGTNELQQHTLPWHTTENEIKLGKQLKANPPQGSPPQGSPPLRRRESPQSFLAYLHHTQTLQSQLEAATTENSRLNEQLTQHQRDQTQAAQQTEIEQLLTESNLPDSAITHLFLQQLESAADKTARQALIHERQQLITQSSRHPPHSRERNPSTTDPDETTIIATLKQHRPTILTGITP